jgi:WD40 repeat protein
LIVALDKPGATAEVLRAGKSVAVKPGEPVGLPPGDYQLVVSGKDYESVRRTIAIRAGENKREVVSLPWKQPLRVFGPIGSPVRALAFAPNGHILAVALNGKLHVLEADSDKEKVLDLKFSPNVIVTAAAFSADGRRALVGSALREKQKAGRVAFSDATLRLWDVAKEKEAGPPIRLARHAVRAALSADGLRALTCEIDGKVQTLRLWNAETGKELGHHIGIAGEQFHNLVAAPEGGWYTLVNHEKEQVLRLWERNLKASKPQPLPGASSGVNAMMFSRDSHRLLAGEADGIVRWWDLATKKELWASPAVKGAVGCVALRPDGRRAVSSVAAVVRLWVLEK